MKITWYLTALRRYARFAGRATRPEFWSFLFGAILVCILVAAAEATFSPQAGRGGPVFAWFVALAHVVPYYAVSARRLHDAGQTGWLSLLNAIPFGSLVVLVLASLPGTLGPNAYGPAPDEHAGERSPGYDDRTARPRHRDPNADGFDFVAGGYPQPRLAHQALPAVHALLGAAPTVAPSPIVSASTAPASAPSPGASRDPIGELERLGQLRASGVISEPEFERLKSRLIDAGS